MVGRKKLGKKPLMARVYPDTPDKLKALALKYGYQYGGDGATGAFLDAIACGEIELVTGSGTTKATAKETTRKH